MYPINSSNVPEPESQYRPYFYQAGLHQRYDLNSMGKSRARSADLEQTGRSNTIDVLLSKDAGPQTVEQVIANGYFSTPSGDPVTAVISDKMHTSWLGLDDLIGQVRKRYEIHQQILYQIELGKCAAMNAIYAHEAYAGPPSSKQMYARHKAIRDLYEQEQMEETTLWKDISRLKVLIPESAQQYLSAYRKSSVLAQEPGDAP